MQENQNTVVHFMAQAEKSDFLYSELLKEISLSADELLNSIVALILKNILEFKIVSNDQVIRKTNEFSNYYELIQKV